MTREDVKRLLMTIEAIYPNFKIRDLQITLDAWYEIMCDQDSSAIFASLKQYSRTSRTGFAPDPGELIQGAYDLFSKNETLSIGEAWSLVRKAISRSSYYAEDEFNKLPPTVQKAVGSPWQLRAWATDSTFNEGVASSNFIKAYETECDRAKADALMAPSVKELIESVGQMKRLSDKELVHG